MSTNVRVLGSLIGLQLDNPNDQPFPLDVTGKFVITAAFATNQSVAGYSPHIKAKTGPGGTGAGLFAGGTFYNLNSPNDAQAYNVAGIPVSGKGYVQDPAPTAYAQVQSPLAAAGATCDLYVVGYELP